MESHTTKHGPVSTGRYAGWCRRRAGVAAVAGLISVLLAGGAPGAAAHDELEDSSPGDGDVVDQAPQELVLTFTSDITTLGLQVQVSGPDGPATDSAAEVVGRQVIQELIHDLAAGEYDVAWRVTSADGHPISGEQSFTVAEAPSSAATGSATSTSDASTSTSEATTSTSEAATSTGSTTATEPAATTTPAAALSEPPDTERDEGSGGLPGWAWAVAALALAGAALWVRVGKTQSTSSVVPRDR